MVLWNGGEAMDCGPHRAVMLATIRQLATEGDKRWCVYSGEAAGGGVDSEEASSYPMV